MREKKTRKDRNKTNERGEGLCREVCMKLRRWVCSDMRGKRNPTLTSPPPSPSPRPLFFLPQTRTADIYATTRLILVRIDGPNFKWLLKDTSIWTRMLRLVKQRETGASVWKTLGYVLLCCCAALLLCCYAPIVLYCWAAGLLGCCLLYFGLVLCLVCTFWLRSIW